MSVARAAPEMAEATLRAFRRWGIGLGVVGVALSAAGLILNVDQFLGAYLVAYLLWLGVSLGCLGLALIHRLTGGFWGDAPRALFFAAADTLPLLALLFVPIALGVPVLYVWARPDAGASDPNYPHQQAYLNEPFFLIRAALYLACWIALARLLPRWTDAWERTGEQDRLWRVRHLAAGGLVALGFSVAFAMIDWVMSLDPTWTSTIFPAVVGAGHLLVGMAFTIGLTCLLGASLLGNRNQLPQLLNDLGGLLLAFVMLWMYLAFSQLLLIWAGNLNAEITWYLSRLSHGWEWVGAFALLALFVVPFCALLSTAVKQSPRALGLLAILLGVGTLVYLTWLVEPSLPPASLLGYLLVVPTTAALGGIWLVAFGARLRDRLEQAGRA